MSKATGRQPIVKHICAEFATHIVIVYIVISILVEFNELRQILLQRNTRNRQCADWMKSKHSLKWRWAMCDFGSIWSRFSFILNSPNGIRCNWICCKLTQIVCHKTVGVIRLVNSCACWNRGSHYYKGHTHTHTHSHFQADAACVQSDTESANKYHEN